MSRDYFSEFESQHEKLEVLLEENDLLHEFDTERYPITLTIRPNITPEAQMALFDRAAEGVSSRDAALVFQWSFNSWLPRSMSVSMGGWSSPMP